MKVTQPVDPNTVLKRTRRTTLQPHERAERSSRQKGEYLAYKVCNIPDEDNLPMYEFPAPYFGTGMCKESLKLCDNLKKVIVGQDIAMGPGKFMVARRLLTGDALAVFENTAIGHDQTNALFAKALNVVTHHVFSKAQCAA